MPTTTTTEGSEREGNRRRLPVLLLPARFQPVQPHTRHITSLPLAPHAAASPTISHHSSYARPSFALPTLHPTTAMRTIIPAFDPCMPQLFPLTHKLPNVPGGLICGIWERAHQSGDALFQSRRGGYQSWDGKAGGYRVPRVPCNFQCSMY